MASIIVWFRQDLRLANNAALHTAAATGAAVVPLYIWSPEEESPWAPGAASRWWLHHSLRALDASLRQRGSRLIIRRGPAVDAILQLAREVGARQVWWNESYDPVSTLYVSKVQQSLRMAGFETRDFPGYLLVPPGSVHTSQGQPIMVFTPFWKTVRQTLQVPRCLSVPERMRAPAAWPRSLKLAELKLLPVPDWAGGLREAWTPGEEGAWQRLNRFVNNHLSEYQDLRDYPAARAVSRLSPHLHFGEITPAQIWHEVVRRPNAEPFLRQLIWREFAYHVLHVHPETTSEPLRPEFRYFEWRDNNPAFKAWCRGETGYPFVDAGMRELWTTGWMHNRVRMVVASFLTKDLLIPWQRGAAWFWDTLVDADLANNSFGWQWTAGCGADAAPYFRIFNPVTQGEKFDPHGEYVRTWVPELSNLPNEWIYRPWEAPSAVLRQAGVRLGHTYPEPIVDHSVTRRRALEAFESVKAAREMLRKTESPR